MATDTSRDDLRPLLAIPSWCAVQPNWLFIARAGPAPRPCRTIEHYLPEFERTYGARFALRYLPWPTIIGTWPAGFFAVAICILALLACV